MNGGDLFDHRQPCVSRLGSLGGTIAWLNVTHQSTPSTIAIGLAFLDADPQQPDPATTGVIARQAVGELQAEGYPIQPVYTGARGGEWFEIGRQLVQMIQDNKELLSALVSLATPIVSYFFRRRDSQGRASQQTQAHVKVEVVIDGKPIEVGAEDTADVDRLVARLLHAQPNLVQTVTPTSTLRVRVHVPPSEKRSL